MKFFGCTDVVSQGFTVSFYANWTSGNTIPGGSPEHSEVVTSLPYSYSPVNPLQQYGILFQKTGWITVVFHAAQVNAGTVNVDVWLAPLAVSVTEDTGAGTMGATASGTTPYTSASVFSGNRLSPEYTYTNGDLSLFLSSDFSCTGVKIAMQQDNAANSYAIRSPGESGNCATPFDATFPFPRAAPGGNSCDLDPNQAILTTTATVTF